MRQRLFDWIIALVSLAVCVLALVYWPEQRWLWLLAGGLAVLFFVLGCLDKKRRLVMTSSQVDCGPEDRAKQLVLLNEDDRDLTGWDLFGRTALVIGRDVGENDVDINLADVTYASFIDIEHAVLNYSNGHWYIEDLSSENGVKVQKQGDDRQYKLATEKPCRLDLGDIIYIAQTKLQVR